MKPKHAINDEIQHVLETMKVLPIGSQEYEAAARALKDLCEARSKKDFSYVIDPDTALLAVSNIMGILLVLNYENLHVLSSKAFGLLRRI